MLDKMNAIACITEGKGRLNPGDTPSDNHD
jgi:hypothetical protein